jgi:predicted enzyme related to lactoylglutathione lyase
MLLLAWRTPFVKFTYTIQFVADMDRAVAFYRDTLGLPLKFASPHWTEFATGETTLAPDLEKFHQAMTAKGVAFSMPPTKQDFGGMLARFADSEGSQISVSNT